MEKVRVPSMTGLTYGAGWLRGFLQRASGLSFEEAHAMEIAAAAERKLVDLFERARDVALANGRERILFHDLPLTRGLQQRLGEAERLGRDLQLRPLIVFLADAGVPGPLDEAVQAAVPRLVAALLILQARVIALLEPENMSIEERLERLTRHTPGRPTGWEVQRAGQLLDLTL